MKRLAQDGAALLAAVLLALLMDRLGVLSLLAARLAPAVETPEAAVWDLPGESAPWRPPAAAAAPEGAAESPGAGESPGGEAPEEALPAAPALAAGELRLGGSLSVDTRSLLREGWGCTLSREGPQVLILHTHSCEAYTPDGADDYTPSGDWRTLDGSQSVIAVGDVLTGILEARGFTVLHDRSLYDWPAYNGAYDRSGEAVRRLLEEHPAIRVVIDLHRDSLGGRKTEYVTPDGAPSAQVMLLLTTGENGLYHPNWRENLKLGLELQSRMAGDYEGLARPLLLSPARYNQHLCPGSFLVEVGTEANTLAEAKKAAALFGDCLAGVLERHWED